MPTATIPNVQVAKTPVDNDFCGYIAGAVYQSGPIEFFDTPRPAADAKGSRSNAELREIAKKRVPPKSWFEGQEEQVF